MTVQNDRSKIKFKTKVNNDKIRKGVKKRRKKITLSPKQAKKNNLFLIVTFFTGVLLIISTYAWFSASIDVRVRFFDLVVSSDSGLFISLDGVDYSSSVEITYDSIISDLGAAYPNHTNQWSAGGMWPVSTNGIRNANSDKFALFAGSVRGYRGTVRGDHTYLNTIRLHEDVPNGNNVFIAFDIFLKNVSGSPNSDNLYFDEGTFIGFDEDVDDEVRESMSGIMNSMRIGLVRVGSTSTDAEPYEVQNLSCNNNCQMVIYEPNSRAHSEASIEKAYEYFGVTLVDGQYTPTYAVINEGRDLELANGHPESGIPLDTEHFALQQTITHFENPIFQIPHGITKFRAYVWIEGQDMDSLETNSKGAAIDIAINFAKDLAGYEY